MMPMLTRREPGKGRNGESHEDREKLIAFLLVAYAFSHEDIARLSSLLAAGYLAAMQRSARRTLSVLGASIAFSWLPSAAMRAEAIKQAREAAKGIAATFSSLLEGFLRRNGTMLDDGDIHVTVTVITSWYHDMLRWKIPQVVNATCGSGNQAGTSAVVQDLLAGKLVSEDDPTVVIEPGDFEIQVMPAESSNDLCADYAGKTFPLEDWETIPDWPAHPLCPHQSILVPVAA